MKIDKTKAFQPITITLENETEANVFRALGGYDVSAAGAISGSRYMSGISHSEARDILTKLYNL